MVSLSTQGKETVERRTQTRKHKGRTETQKGGNGFKFLFFTYRKEQGTRTESRSQGLRLWLLRLTAREKGKTGLNRRATTLIRETRSCNRVVWRLLNSQQKMEVDARKLLEKLSPVEASSTASEKEMRGIWED